jgi:hypothetical protein
MLSAPSCAGVRQEAREQERTHLGDRGAYGVPLVPEDVPVDDRAARRHELTDPGGLRAFRELGVIERGLADPGEIALHICQKHRHAALREALG